MPPSMTAGSWARMLAWGLPLALLCQAVPARADEIVVSGDTTVLNLVVNPHRAAVEQATGHHLRVNANATGRGLVDLVEGRSAMAMCAEPLDMAVTAAEAAGRVIDPGSLVLHEIRHDEIVFVVHPDNRVRRLTWAQLKDIHTGKVSNWKVLGGADRPIHVYADALTGGTRAMVQKIVLQGASYGARVQAQINVRRVGEVVGADPDGIGALGRGFVELGRNRIVQAPRIDQPLGFVTLGAPSPQVQAVIAGFRHEVQQEDRP